MTICTILCSRGAFCTHAHQGGQSIPFGSGAPDTKLSKYMRERQTIDYRRNLCQLHSHGTLVAAILPLKGRCSMSTGSRPPGSWWLLIPLRIRQGCSLSWVGLHQVISSTFIAMDMLRGRKE